MGAAEFTAEQLDFPVKASGSVQAANELNKLGDSMKQRTRDWDSMSKSSSKATAALGAASMALGPLGAEFGVLGQNVSRATGIITNMTSLLGGPWGIAIGLAVTGAGLLAKHFSDASDKADELAKSTAKARAERQKLVEEVNAAEAKRAFDDDMRVRGELMDIETRRQILRDNPDAVLTGIRNEFKKPPANGNGGGKKRKTLDDLMNDASASGDIGDLAGSGMGSPEIDMMEQERQALADADAAREAQRLEQKKLNDEIYIETERNRLEQTEALEAIHFERQAANENAMLELRRGVARDSLNVAMRGLNELVKGNKVTGKQIVQGIGDSLVARGTEAVWQGTLMSLNPFTPGIGAPLIAGGLAAVGAGLAMGAASRAMPGASGAGSGAMRATGQQMAPASPVSSVGGSAGGSDRPINVNVYMSSTLAPTSEDGVRVLRAIDQAKREGRAA